MSKSVVAAEITEYLNLVNCFDKNLEPFNYSRNTHLSTFSMCLNIISRLILWKRISYNQYNLFYQTLL